MRTTAARKSVAVAMDLIVPQEGDVRGCLGAEMVGY
jgi:hypothetical protein